jgi:putative ABC transport system permease protein
MYLKGVVPTETIAMAIGNIRAHKFRSFLTVLGIVIGVVVVIVVASLLTGMRNSIVRIIEDFGTNNIYAFHLSTGPRLGPRDRAEWKRKPLTPEDGDAVKRLANAVSEVSKVGWMWRIDTALHYGGQKYQRGQVQGVSPSHATVANLSIHEGRFISEVDDEHRRDVVVLGVNAVEALFPNRGTVVGTHILIGDRTFEVIGVLEKRKSGFFGENEEDNAVMMPFQTARKISPQDDFMMLMVQAKSGRIPEALDQVRDILRRQRGLKFNDPDNFDLSTANKIVEQFDSITGAIGMIAIAISSVGLLVGGIGVMNIMLVSVTERTREIGVRKAIGARRKDIISQFLFEAMTLTFLGGALGVVIAIGISYLLMVLIPSIPATIPMWAVIAGLSVSILVGLVFGVWPARKASALDPIEALRYE